MRRRRRHGWEPGRLAAAWAAAALLCAPGARAQLQHADDGSFKTGELISLDLKGVDIIDVLKLLSQKGELNFVAGQNVSGRVTIFAKDVDVWDAFELIVDANDLAYDIRGDMISVMTARDYELNYGQRFQEPTRQVALPLKHASVVQVVAILNQVKSAVGRIVADETTNTLVLRDTVGHLADMRRLIENLDRPTESRVYRLQYADAEKIGEKFVELLTPVGTATVDARTNRIIVRDMPERLERLDQIVRAFDIPDGQVLIEAKIISVLLSDDLSLGIDWERVLGGIDARARSNFRVLGDVVGGTATGGALSLLSAPGGNTRIVLEALKVLGRTETLSNPRIMVSNRQEARILIGTRQAAVTVTTTVPASGSVVTAPEIQYVDVGTKLFVTPEIRGERQVQLKIRPEVSTATIEEFADSRVPIVTTTEAETTVLVNSGVTLVIGGLIDVTNQRTDRRVPGLGDIPILGAPFRGLTDTKSKRELVVFLTPTITRPDGTAVTAAAGPGEGQPGDAPGIVLRDPIPAGYQQDVRQRLRAHLISAFQEAKLEPGSVTVAFVLRHDGTVESVEEITSSGGDAYVAAAHAALAAAGPFPPFPEGAGATQVRFRLAVEYEGW
ncbi:MAG TPA: TonB family protein [bacterium]